MKTFRLLSLVLALLICITPTVFAKGEVDTNFVTPVVLYGDTGSALVHIKANADGAVFANGDSQMAQKITQPDANTSYVGVAPVGTAQATAGWQAYKVLVSGTTTTITWANGDTNFDNVATDLTALTYS